VKRQGKKIIRLFVETNKREKKTGKRQEMEIALWVAKPSSG